MRVLVTAGNTREMIDLVRDWGNIFSGNTGYSIAKAIAEIHEVDLLTSNPQHLAEAHAVDDHRLHASGFTSHEDLTRKLASLMSQYRYDAVFMTAAVAELNGATLVHYHRHFDAISRVTGQVTEWLAPPGTLD